MIFLLVILAFSQSAYANDPKIEDKLIQDWRWTEFDITFGLEFNDIIDVIESNGIIWAVTSKGFAWYDNYRWNFIPDSITKYLRNPSNTFRTPNILPGNKGELIAVNNGGLSFISKNGILNKYFKYSGKKLFIHDFAIFNNSSFLIIATLEGSFEKKIYKIQKNSINPFIIPSDFDNSGLKNIITFTCGSDGSVWLNTNLGIYVLQDGNWKKLFKSNLTSIFDFTKPLLSPNGEYVFYIGFPNYCSGLWHYNKQNGLELVDSLKIMLLSSDMNNLGKIFHLYYGGQLEEYANKKWNIIKNTPNLLKNATNIRFSSNGDLWVSSYQKLYLCKLSSNRWKNWYDNTTYKRTFINEIIKTKDDCYWVAYGDGIGRIKDGVIVEFHKKAQSIQLEGVTAINDDQQGNIWVGSGGGYFKNTFKWNGKKWDEVVLLPNKEPVQIHKIRKDKKNRLWFLTLSDNSKDKGYGALVYDNNKVVEIWDISKGLLSSRVYDFLEDDEGAYWFATYFGLSKYKDGVWKHWNTENGLRADLIFSLALHPDGKTVYYSNTSKGIGYIKNDKPYFLRQLDSLNITQVASMAFEKNGNLWIGTKSGLYCMVDNSVFSINHQLGLSSNFIWPLLIDKDKILIGTFGAGINVLDLSEREQPAPIINFYSSFNSRDEILIRWNIWAYKGICRQIDFYIRYRLDGGDWSFWQKSNYVNLENLDFGEHKVEFQLINYTGKIIDDNYNYRFVIDKPIFLKPEFFLPLTFLFIIIIVSIVYYTKKISKHIKELEKSKNDLLESEMSNEYIIDNTSDALMVTENGIIKFCNPLTSSMSGYGMEELVGKPIIELADNEYKDSLIELQKKLINAEKSSFTSDIKVRTKDGTPLWVEIRLSSMPTQDGYKSIIMISDIEKRKEYEQKLKEALLKEKELGELKSSIIATISHEYRTPLTIMQTSADLLKIYYQLKNDEKFHNNISRINDAIERMTHFLEDIMLLGKIESRNLDFNYDDTDIVQFCNDVIAKITAKNDRGHKFNFNFENLPKHVSVEPYLLLEILSRVLSNATNYSPDGSLVDINVIYLNNQLLFRIKDNGFGIEQDKLNRIFEPFYRVINSEATPGTGFGLTIVKGCLDALGGSIKIDSKPYSGTVVEIIIPILKKNG